MHRVCLAVVLVVIASVCVAQSRSSNVPLFSQIATAGATQETDIRISAEAIIAAWRAVRADHTQASS